MELGKLYCETDAAWEAFCRCPSDATWALYVEAKDAEDAESRLTLISADSPIVPFEEAFDRYLYALNDDSFFSSKG